MSLSVRHGSEFSKAQLSWQVFHFIVIVACLTNLLWQKNAPNSLVSVEGPVEVPLADDKNLLLDAAYFSLRGSVFNLDIDQPPVVRLLLLGLLICVIG